MPVRNVTIPAAFKKNVEKLDGQQLSAGKMGVLLAQLDGKPAEVQAAAAQWLVSRGDAGNLTIGSVVKATLQSFIADNGGVLDTATSPINTRLSAGTAPKFSDNLRDGITRGTDLATRRDELSWKTRRTPPAADEFFTPPTKMKLDAGDGKKDYLVYVSKQTGIDMDTHKVKDVEKAQDFVLFDQSSGKYTSEIHIARPQTATIPGAGTTQPGEDLPKLGAKLPPVVSRAVEDGLDLATRRDGEKWRASSSPPSDRDHFKPSFTMKIRDDNGKELQVQVFFSKQAVPSFANPPGKPEESKQVTLYDPRGKQVISNIPILMPQRVTLPVIGGV